MEKIVIRSDFKEIEALLLPEEKYFVPVAGHGLGLQISTRWLDARDRKSPSRSNPTRVIIVEKKGDGRCLAEKLV